MLRVGFDSKPTIVLLIMLISSVAVPSTVTAQCQLSGTATVQPSDIPEFGLYKYCIDVDWNAGHHGLSHLDVILGLAECVWVCDGFCFDAHNPAGSSMSPPEDSIAEGVDDTGPPREGTEDGCVVYYRAEFSCDGDASIEGVIDPLVKFEPIEGECEPGAQGVGTYCFYTNWPPIPVYVPNNYLVVKAGQDVCFGQVAGALPGCSFPSATQSESWGMLRYRFK